MSCSPLPNEAAKPVWANQLTRLPCLMDVYQASIRDYLAEEANHHLLGWGLVTVIWLNIGNALEVCLFLRAILH